MGQYETILVNDAKLCLNKAFKYWLVMSSDLGYFNTLLKRFGHHSGGMYNLTVNLVNATPSNDNPIMCNNVFLYQYHIVVAGGKASNFQKPTIIRERE